MKKDWLNIFLNQKTAFKVINDEVYALNKRIEALENAKKDSIPVKGEVNAK
jgi:hypothetical protein